MQRYVNNFTNSYGAAISGASVLVTTLAGATAVIYSDNGITPAANPLTTDENGFFSFYAADGRYSLAITSSVTVPVTLTDILLEDPADANTANINGGTISNVALQNVTIDGETVAGSDVARYSTLAENGGAALVGFIQAGTGAVARKTQAKLRDVVSVKDFGAVGDGATDDSAAFTAAVNALPAAGGKIEVPDANYNLSYGPALGDKSVMWNFGPGSAFSGAGAANLNRMATNGNQVAVGPYIRSQSAFPSPAGGGIAAFNIEMLQPAGYVGQSVGLYVGAYGNNADAGANVWAINPLIRVGAAALGTYQCLEVDVDCFTTSALVKGISLNGAGPSNPDIALEVIRTGVSRWERGIDINQAVVGLMIRTDGLSRGIVVGTPATFADTIMSGKQLANGADSIVLQRNTDTSPSGYFARGVDAANSTTLWSVDYSGALFSAGHTVKSDQSAGLTGLLIENSSTAGVTTKTTGIKFRGRDTVNSLKDAGEVLVTPTNSNLTGSTMAFRTRISETVADRLVIDAGANLALQTVGAGLRVKEGSNAKQGTATLVAGTVTVANTSVTANSRIMLTSQSDGGTPGFLRVSARVVGTSFTITSSSGTDTSTVAYQIFEPA